MIRSDVGEVASGSATRIVEARVTPILIGDPPLLNLQGVHQPWTPRTIVEVVTATGAIGVGETYGDPDYLQLAQVFAPELAGGQLTALGRMRAGVAAAAERVTLGSMDQSVTAAGLRGSRTIGKLANSVYSAFEVACLDALGHEVGLPVHALLGGKVRDRVEYSGYLFYRWAEHPEGAEGGGFHDEWGAALDPAGVVAQARGFAERYGFRSFKLKGGVFAPALEVEAIRALRAEFPDHPLRLDPNGAWSVPTSLAVAEALRDTLEYLEDPTTGTENMARVARATPVPLATNMCVTAVEEIEPAFGSDAVQVVLSDHHYWGGLRATQDLAAVCRAYHREVSMHSNTHLGISLAAMTQVAATIPELTYACDSHRPWQREDVITEPHEFVDGAVAVSDAPGLGVELDRVQLAELHERWLALEGMRARDDAAAMRRFDPDWVLPHW